MEHAFTHLKDEAWYDNFYDRLTVEECRRIVARPAFQSPSASETPHEAWVRNYTKELALYVTTGERYAKKDQTIRQWMARDQEHDTRLAQAVYPRIYCRKCQTVLNCSSRSLARKYEGAEDAVLFMLKCPACLKPAAYWENGQEWDSTHRCPKCSEPMEDHFISEDQVWTIRHRCAGCTHTETTQLDLRPQQETPDPHFLVDRKKYCLSPEEGGQYIQQMAMIRKITSTMKEPEDAQELYTRMAQLKRLTIAKVAQLLLPSLQAAGYGRLELGKPASDRDVIVSFAVQDQKVERKEYDSVHQLKTVLLNALLNTN